MLYRWNSGSCRWIEILYGFLILDVKYRFTSITIGHDRWFGITFLGGNFPFYNKYPSTDLHWSSYAGNFDSFDSVFFIFFILWIAVRARMYYSYMDTQSYLPFLINMTIVLLKITVECCSFYSFCIVWYSFIWRKNKQTV